MRRRSAARRTCVVGRRVRGLSRDIRVGWRRRERLAVLAVAAIARWPSTTLAVRPGPHLAGRSSVPPGAHIARRSPFLALAEISRYSTVFDTVSYAAAVARQQAAMNALETAIWSVYAAIKAKVQCDLLSKPVTQKTANCAAGVFVSPPREAPNRCGQRRRETRFRQSQHFEQAWHSRLRRGV